MVSQCVTFLPLSWLARQIRCAEAGSGGVWGGLQLPQESKAAGSQRGRGLGSSGKSGASSQRLFWGWPTTLLWGAVADHQGRRGHSSPEPSWSSCQKQAVPADKAPVKIHRHCRWPLFWDMGAEQPSLPSIPCQSPSESSKPGPSCGQVYTVRQAHGQLVFLKSSPALVPLGLQQGWLTLAVAWERPHALHISAQCRLLWVSRDCGPPAPEGGLVPSLWHAELLFRGQMYLSQVTCFWPTLPLNA